jgi:HPt (histidine-containing phosphotransfer) domain-containing protein
MWSMMGRGIQNAESNGSGDTLPGIVALQGTGHPLGEVGQPGSAPSVEHPVVPLDELLSQTANNRSLIVELIEIFEDESSSMLAELHRSVEARDAKGMLSAAHRFRGSLRIFGAKRALEAATDLETMGREGVFERASGRLLDLVREVDRALDALRAYRRALAPVDRATD